jgi:lipopolysaccharide transport system ATP-binding protein
MQSVAVLCNKAMYLEKGVCTYAGDVPTAIEHYMKSFKNPASAAIDPQRRPGTGEYRFTKVEPAKEFFTCGEEKVIKFTINRFKPSTARFFLSCEVVNSLGAVIAQCDSRLVNFWIDPCDRFEGEFSIKTPWLKPGNYRADIYICSAGVLDSFQQACPLNVSELLPYPSTGNNEATSTGLVFGDFSYTASPGPGNE